jgi:hypothetical protein
MAIPTFVSSHDQRLPDRSFFEAAGLVCLPRACGHLAQQLKKVDGCFLFGIDGHTVLVLIQHKAR